MAISPSPSTRPHNALLLTSFALLSAAGLWFMSINTYLHDAPVGFTSLLAAGEHPNGLRIKTRYTGVVSLDTWLSFLVTAFIPGTAAWNEAWYWQQMHFLTQLGGVIAVMNVEGVCILCGYAGMGMCAC
jgi:hypothetical protein